MLNLLSKSKELRKDRCLTFEIGYLKVSSALGLIGSAICFLNAIFSVIVIDSFLQEFGTVRTIYYVQGIVALIVGILGVIGSLRRATLGAFLMIGGCFLMFLVGGLYFWLPCGLLFAGGIMALREKEIYKITKQTPS